jgi:hypothetical protein
LVRRESLARVQQPAHLEPFDEALDQIEQLLDDGQR